MKTLYLSLKKEWYEMIERGEKTEEYREIKRHWAPRIMRCFKTIDGCTIGDHGCFLKKGLECSCLRYKDNIKTFDAVRFSYGRTRRTMTFEVKSITIGQGRPEWGAPDGDVFIIKLGKRL